MANEKDNTRYKPRPISGYPEWLPEQRAVELQWLDTIRSVFESYGYCNIETPSVEELDALTAKGGDEKEIYTLTRLHADPETDKEARLALHFDLTVPLARYAAQHFNALTFPFKRYQMQRVWRGERPQKGRFREFYQCDIDVINIDHLPLYFDAEMPQVMYDVYQKLDLPEDVQIRISNRKILTGYLEGLGVAPQNMTAVTRILDKFEKIGAENVMRQLVEDVDLQAKTAEKALALASIRGSADGIAEALGGLGIENAVMGEGIEELVFVLESLSHLPEGAAIADLSIVRGLDYYTGTILEAVFPHDTGFGSIGSGGRYDDLTGSFINRKMPGIGISIGLTRLFSRMVEQNALQVEAGRVSPTDILVVQQNEAAYQAAQATARILRSRGFNVETFHSATKMKKQLAYAEKKSIPFVWFPPAEQGGGHEVKDMALHTQQPADPEDWQPENPEILCIRKKM